MKSIIIKIYIIAILPVIAFNVIENNSTIFTNKTAFDPNLNDSVKSTIPAVKYIAISGEINLEYAETGEKNRPPVIFLHGYSDSWKSFLPILPYLPKSIHGYYLSQRGHGNSSKPIKGYRPEHFAADLYGFMNALDIQSAIIVGHSMGSVVAQRFALDFPEKTKALVLIGSFPSLATNAGIRELCQYVDTMSVNVDTGFVQEFQKSTIYKPVPADYFDTVLSESLKVPAHSWKGVSNDLLKTDLTRELVGVTKPTLLIHGTQDNVSLSQDQDVLLSVISGSVLKEYEQIGHAVHWEDPQHFASDLISFIQKIK